MGITGLSRTLRSLVGSSTPSGTFEGIEWESVRKVVLLVLDGLGLRQLKFAMDAGAVPNLERAMDDGGLMELTTTLPSTTATALVSLSTSTQPSEHGFLGFTLYLREVRAMVDMIRLSLLEDQRDLESLGLGPATLAPTDTILSHARGHGWKAHALTLEAFVDSAFSKILYRGSRIEGYRECPDMALRMARLCRQDGRALILAYWDLIDILCHRHGSMSNEFLAAISTLDYALGREFLRSDLKRTLLLITADHGHIDSFGEKEVDLKEHGELMSYLSLPPTGDARLPYLHTGRRGLKRALDYLDDHFDDIADWIEADGAMKAGLFGTSGSSRWRDRLGDIILFHKEDYCFTYPHRDKQVDFVGRHGGTSPEEMVVPLIWCRL
jgi:predicted AlkP superfamily pyrophosphatase or phosphodiesterase